MSDQAVWAGNPRSDNPGQIEARSRPIIDWLLGEERQSARRTNFLIDSFVRRLRDADLPVDRASMHMRQIHPQLAARSFVWDIESGGATEMGYRHSARDEISYIASPVRPVFETGATIRRRLDTPGGRSEFPILAELADRGFTDYIIMPLPFANGLSNAVSLTTQRKGGFKPSDFALFDAVLPAFATVLELQQTRRMARDLLSTYVGPNTGERIFNGTIQRGDGEVIHAILWFCDLRGFTAMSQAEPLDQVIDVLNTYFDCMAGPVTARGGEILKFVGDAMLAIFSCEAENATECNALEAALGAAEEAVSAITALNAVRRAVGQNPLEVGIALHIGDVMYGNIGAADRLDFTVIGPAVNLVCRVESLSAQLQRSILVSKDLARLAPELFVSLGEHDLKGLSEPKEIFGLAQTKALAGSA
mgnify:FL=1